MPVWTSQDPRQAETYRLLKLLGDAPADFFADSCRLMSGEPGLAATTHVVGHLLREIEGYFGGVLEPMIDPARLPARNSPNAHPRRIALFADALGVAADDPFRDLWIEYATGLSRWAHRDTLAAPRPVDAAFTELWDKAQTVIFRIAERVESPLGACRAEAPGGQDGGCLPSVRISRTESVLADQEVRRKSGGQVTSFQGLRGWAGQGSNL